jgi:hypothetical protein
MRALALLATLALALAPAAPATALSCLNSKPCDGKCIPYAKACVVYPPCPKGQYRCHTQCIPDRILCAIN